MTGGTYRGYSESMGSTKKSFSDDAGERARAEADRKKRLDEDRARMGEKKTRETRDKSTIYNRSHVRLGITRPAPGVKKIHFVLVDNSGSNRVIAQHMKNGSGYIMGVLNGIDPQSQTAFNYFSDHTDGTKRCFQEVDFVSSDKEGDQILYSSLEHVEPANGYDAAEAIECALWNACKIDFGEATERHLYLITDVVAHGMGLSSDDGCPFQRDWREALALVKETYTSFAVIGCGDSPRVGILQKQFISPERLAYDLIDLSSIPEDYHRMAITANTFLFLVARSTGMQGVEMFLSLLYGKWVKDAIFGEKSDERARETLRKFGKYLEAPVEEVERMMNRIFV
ncbi:MAG: hypothetical protein V1867_02830 [Candidatus Falkowbacteria bacterium]